MTEIWDKAFWNALYAEKPALWSGRPNPNLVSDASTLRPGTALDVGSGEGGDALWLAAQGWRVTAVDISAVALDRARAAAATFAAELTGVTDEKGTSATPPVLAHPITFEEHDVLEWSPSADSFDLVSGQYLHFPAPGMTELVPRLAAAVRLGGTLLLVGHAISDHAHHPVDFFYTGAELADLLPGGWEVVSTTDRQHPTREGFDAVLNARRTR